MKSTIIRPLAAALMLLSGAGVQAQSSVSVFGLVDMSAGRNQAPGGKSFYAADSGKMTTSFLGFRGREDLGGGLSANFSLEHFFRADSGEAGRFNGDAFWSRSAWVGLSGGFGSVNLGRNTTALFVNTLSYNAFGDSFGYSPSIRHYFTSGTTTGDTGWSDSVRYLSPRFGGASFTAHVAAGEGNGGRNHGLSAGYSGGPVAVGLVWQEVKKGATLADTTTWQLGGSFDFQVAKLYAQYGQVDNDTTGNAYKIAGLGAAVPIGQGRALLQWGRIKPDIGASRKTLSVGYDYNLSKRTDVYGVFMSDKISGLSKGNNFGIGIRHRF